MRVKGRSAPLAIGLIAFLSIGCSLSRAPENWLPVRSEAGHDPFGAWVDVWTTDPKFPLGGELIAVSPDSLFFLGYDSLQGIGWKEIRKYRVAYYQSEGGYQGAFVFTSTLGTFSHGIGLIYSAPIWIVAGGLTAALSPHEPMITSRSWETLSPFARFPQGLPPSLVRENLRPKIPAPNPRYIQSPYVPLAFIGILQLFIGIGLSQGNHSDSEDF